jgi:hypothetical protein
VSTLSSSFAWSSPSRVSRVARKYTIIFGGSSGARVGFGVVFCEEATVPRGVLVLFSSVLRFDADSVERGGAVDAGATSDVVVGGLHLIAITIMPF